MLNSEACDEDNLAASKDYCTWTYTQEDWGDAYEWGCGTGATCQAFSDGYCSFVDVELSVADCNGGIQNSTVKQYFYCCDGENCNYGISDVDINTECTRSQAYENLYKDYYGCLYAPNSARYTYRCDDDVQEITCTAVEAIFSQQVDCDCAAYRELYNLVDPASQQSIQDDIDKILDGYNEWNDVLGCNFQLTCDLSNSASPTTPMPTTMEPTTATPTAPVTAMPTTAIPTTSEPTTDSPTTDEPTTMSPTKDTDDPTTAMPTTKEPTSADPTTSEPTTDSPTTDQPTTNEPTTTSPTKDTDEPTTDMPTTSMPTTAEPTTDNPTTVEPTEGQTEEPTEEPTMQPTFQPTMEPVITSTEMDSIVIINETAKVDDPANAGNQIMCVFTVSVVLFALFCLY